MARNRRRNRDTSAISLERVLASVSEPLPVIKSTPSPLAFQDRRRFHFEKDKPAHDLFTGRRSRIVTAAPARTSGKKQSAEQRRLAPSHPRFAESPRYASPQSTSVCIRRQKRREVIFALRKAGKGARSKKHFNQLSAIRCK